MRPDRDTLLALSLQLPPAERVALAHALLKSAAEGRVESGPAGEVAEAAAVYDSAFRATAQAAPASSEGLWESIQAFRATTDLESLDIEGALADVRDRSPGRGVVW